MTDYPETIYVWIGIDEESQDAILILKKSDTGYRGKYSDIYGTLGLEVFMVQDRWSDYQSYKKLEWQSSLEECLEYRKKIIQEQIEELKQIRESSPIIIEEKQ